MDHIKFFNEIYFNYYRDTETSSNLSKKSSTTNQSDLIKLNVVNLKESESIKISELINFYSSSEISVYNLIKDYLKNLSIHYQFSQW